MPKVISNKFTNKQLLSLKGTGRYADGGGLYFQITKTGAKSWIFRYRYEGKNYEMGLGSFNNKSLKEAREDAVKCKNALDAGLNPIKANLFKPDEKPDIPTFKEFGIKMLGEWKKDFCNASHIKQWEKSIREHSGKIANKKVNEITTDNVVDALKEIWESKPETAKRTMGRIRKVLDAAKIAGLRSGENPAVWTGHLEYLLSRQKRLTRGHMKAVPIDGMPDFWEKLSKLNSKSASALKFVILTAVRSGEARLAIKSEFDLNKKVWNVPAERMKMKRPHSVPLSDLMIEIIKEDWDNISDDDYIFKGNNDKPLSDMALIMCLRGLTEKGMTVHGFRSTFRDWAGDCTNFPRELAEAALAHAVGDATEQAYRRSDALERRRKLMQAWEQYITTPKRKDNVVSINSIC